MFLNSSEFRKTEPETAFRILWNHDLTELERRRKIEYHMRKILTFRDMKQVVRFPHRSFKRNTSISSSFRDYL